MNSQASRRAAVSALSRKSQSVHEEVRNVFVDALCDVFCAGFRHTQCNAQEQWQSYSRPCFALNYNVGASLRLGFDLGQSNSVYARSLRLLSPEMRKRQCAIATAKIVSSMISRLLWLRPLDLACAVSRCLSSTANEKRQRTMAMAIRMSSILCRWLRSSATAIIIYPILPLCVSILYNGVPI